MKKYIRGLNESFGTSVSLIEEEDIPGVLDVLEEVFGHIDPREEIERKLRKRLLNGFSIKIEEGGKILGCYIINPKSVNEFISDIENDKLSDFKSYNTEIYMDEDFSDNGLQGIALALLPEYRNMGYGDTLRKWYDNDPRFDYIWGVQDKKLGNIENWKRSRDIIAECPTHFATLKKLNYGR